MPIRFIKVDTSVHDFKVDFSKKKSDFDSVFYYATCTKCGIRGKVYVKQKDMVYLSVGLKKLNNCTTKEEEQ